MDPGGLLSSLSGLWIVPLLLLFIWVGIFGLVQYWQQQVQRELKKVAPTFVKIQAESKRIVEDIRQYSADDPPPYGPLTAATNRILDENANELVALKNSFIDVRIRINRYHFRIWKQFISAPFYWYTWYAIRGDVKRLNSKIASLDRSIIAGRNSVQEIRRQAWLVALEARETLEIERSVRSFMEFLGDHRFVGDRFELAAAQEEVVIDVLDQIPRYFFISDENSISAQASKESVCAVFDHLQRIKSSLNNLHIEVSAWKEEYHKLGVIIGQMREQLSRTRQLLDLVPNDISSHNEEEQIRSMQTIADNLSATLHRLEVEVISLVGEEAHRIEQAAVILGNKIRRGLRQFNTMSTLLAEIKQSQKEISALITEKAKSTTYPLNWDRTRSEFREINKQINLLGNDDQNRTLEEIDRDLEISNGLYVRIQGLLTECRAIALQHDSLVELLVGDQIRSGLDWCQGASKLGNQVALYHPDNWLKSDGANTLFEDIHYLASRYQSEVPIDSSTSIKESDLPELLIRIQGLIDEQKRLRGRADKIQVRLSWIQGIEDLTRDTLQNTRNLFHQLVWIINSNEYLKQTAASEIEQFRIALDKLSFDLNQHQAGLVEKKARSCKSLIDEVEAASNRWLAQLNQDIRRRRDELALRLMRLSEVAVLEDPAIERVKRLLAKDAHTSSTEKGKPIFHLTLEESINELSDRSNYWQECVAVHRELEEIVEAPLLDAVRHAETQRLAVFNLYSLSTRRVSDRHSWPPSSITLIQERREYDSLEQEWGEVKSQHGRAIWAVRRYADLAAKYQSLETKLDQAMQWASQEQRRVIDLEKEIGRSLREIQLKEQALNDQPLEAERLNRVRLQATRAVESLRTEWLASSGEDKGGITYDEIYNGMIKVIQRMQGISESMELSTEDSGKPLGE